MDKFVLAKLIFFFCCWSLFPQQEIVACENLVEYSIQIIETQATEVSTQSKSTMELATLTENSMTLATSSPQATLSHPHTSHFQCGVSTLRIYANEDDNTSDIQPAVQQTYNMLRHSQVMTTKGSLNRQNILPEELSHPYTRHSIKHQINNLTSCPTIFFFLYTLTQLSLRLASLT